MKKILNVPILVMLGIALTFTACDEDNENDSLPIVEYPSLKVVNESAESSRITGVSLVGYSFGSLNIDVGSSQTFALDKDMSAGYEDINVIVGFRAENGSYGTESIEVNFYKGETITITLKGCNCAGMYYLE